MYVIGISCIHILWPLYEFLLGGPSFSESSEFKRAALHDSVTFTCDPTSVPDVTGFVWMRDGNNLSNQSTLTIKEALPNQSTLTIEEANYDDEGVYLCVANNQFNSGIKRFELKVRSKIFLIILVHI